MVIIANQVDLKNEGSVDHKQVLQDADFVVEDMIPPLSI